jgi:hypothetical protein
MNKDEIIKLKEHRVKTVYSATRSEQKIDQTYYDDLFPVPWIHNPKQIVRVGLGKSFCDTPIPYIITDKPVATVENNDPKLTKEVNRQIKIHLLKNPDPFREHARILNKRGEAWIWVMHDERCVTGSEEDRMLAKKYGALVDFILPEPMNIYASTKEINGVPEDVIIWYQRDMRGLQDAYPGWTPPTDIDPEQDINFDFLRYISKTQDFVMINNEYVLDKENLYGFVPLVHSLAGYGSSSPDAKLEDQIVGRLRSARPTLQRITAMYSNLDSVIHLFANESIDVIAENANVEESELQKCADGYVFGAGLAHLVPYGVKIERAQQALPEDAVFRYANMIEATAAREEPLAMLIGPQGRTGRQEEIVNSNMVAPYTHLATATKRAFSVAMGMALRLQDKPENGGIPGLQPEGLSVNAINGKWTVEIELKASDPIADDRRAQLGNRLFNDGIIDERTNLIQYQGKTADEAEDIIINKAVDGALKSAPIQELIIRKAVEKLGLEEEVEKMQRLAAHAGVTPGLIPQVGGEGRTPTDIMRTRGEAKTERGFTEADISLETKPARPSAMTL